MREVELKLAVHGSFVMPDLRSDDLGIAAADELPRLETRTTYYDSEDLRLARYGITLRHRTGEEGGPSWSTTSSPSTRAGASWGGSGSSRSRAGNSIGPGSRASRPSCRRRAPWRR